MPVARCARCSATFSVSLSCTENQGTISDISALGCNDCKHASCLTARCSSHSATVWFLTIRNTLCVSHVCLLQNHHPSQTTSYTPHLPCPQQPPVICTAMGPCDTTAFVCPAKCAGLLKHDCKGHYQSADCKSYHTVKAVLAYLLQ